MEFINTFAYNVSHSFATKWHRSISIGYRVDIVAVLSVAVSVDVE